ncbi:GNAT family N-acetyltransferase [Streptomyces iconiensis]|uniref:GNAT family N-acetyltransferase n=1 Tax=Streptomyces iconiensis TaxID=1384038 RepID=A0ABT7A944_9ACTN|nr:GNAT family N-acetyltransferase [Streptomyces iconiensis]MDJ1137858.1 GNAT family N-acetyltransferase [Streptomyces iconiensis]
MSVDWVRLTLDLNAFDETPFEPRLRKCREAGITFTTMSELGDTAENRRALYELNKTCAADIPERGEFYTYDAYVAERIETPTYNPCCVTLALEGPTWVGMSTASLHPDHAFNEMTGVLPTHRAQGLALSLKLLTLTHTRTHDVPTVTTFHHPANTAMITLNRQLGHVPVADANGG